jgi:hypothetical protein
MTVTATPPAQRKLREERRCRKSGFSAGSRWPSSWSAPCLDVEYSRVALSPLECQSVRAGPI